MKWRSRKLATAHINGGFLDDKAFPAKGSFMRTAIRVRQFFVNRLRRKSTYVELISALLIILFVYTGLNKLMDIEKFRFEMGRSPFIQNMAGFIAYALPIGELLLAAFLISPKARLLGLHLSLALMALFTGYIYLMLNYAYDLPCSCGGIISNLSWNEHLLFNIIFTGLSIVAIFFQSNFSRSRD